MRDRIGDVAIARDRLHEPGKWLLGSRSRDEACRGREPDERIVAEAAGREPKAMVRTGTEPGDPESGSGRTQLPVALKGESRLDSVKSSHRSDVALSVNSDLL